MLRAWRVCAVFMACAFFLFRAWVYVCSKGCLRAWVQTQCAFCVLRVRVCVSAVWLGWFLYKGQSIGPVGRTRQRGLACLLLHFSGGGRWCCSVAAVLPQHRSKCFICVVFTLFDIFVPLPADCGEAATDDVAQMRILTGSKVLPAGARCSPQRGAVLLPCLLLLSVCGILHAHAGIPVGQNPEALKPTVSLGEHPVADVQRRRLVTATCDGVQFTVPNDVPFYLACTNPADDVSGSCHFNAGNNQNGNA